MRGRSKIFFFLVCIALGPGAYSVRIFHVLPVSAWILSSFQRHAFGERQTGDPKLTLGVTESVNGCWLFYMSEALLSLDVLSLSPKGSWERTPPQEKIKGMSVDDG